MIELRPLTADLRDAAAAFANAIPEQDKGFADPFLFYQVAVSSWTQATPARRVVAVEPGPPPRIVGMVSVIPGHGWKRHVAEFRLIVLPETRGRGLGTQLIERGLELVKELGLRKTTVEIMASNETGLALFAHQGFRREALLERHVIDGSDQLQDLVIVSREFD
jgi:ribosomal protein S18 acetylase RimI-like enzyme